MVGTRRGQSASTPFRVIGKSRISQSIVDQILESILSGAYTPGDGFLSERALADEFQVGRSSVREALRILEFAGVLEIKVGSGTYLTDDALSKVTLMRAHAAAVGDKSPLDIIVTRICVEPTSARLAAQLHKRSDLEQMRTHLSQHRAMVEAGEDPSEPDVQFHRAMGAACKNTVLSAIVDQLVQMMHESTWSELKGKSRKLDGHAVQALEDHEAIFAAIVDRDGERAAAATEEHLRRIENGLFQAYDLG